MTYRGDDHSYLLLARSLKDCHKYNELFHPENRPHTQYPPGYPAALAVLGAMFGENILVYKMFSLFCGIIMLALAWLFIRGKINPKFLPFAMATAALNGTLLSLSSSILSEVFFMLVLYAAFIAISAHPERVSWKRFVAGAALCAATYYVRSAGVFVIAGVGLFLLYKKSWERALVFGLISVALLSPWAIRNAGVDKSAGVYIGGQLMAKDYYNLDAGKAGPKDLAVRSIKNAVHIALVELPSTFVPQISDFALAELTSETNKARTQLRNLPRVVANNPTPKTVLSLILIFAVSPALMLIMLKGFVKDVRDGVDCVQFVTVIYVGLITLWPEVWLHFRLLLPVYFFFWTYFVKGLESMKWPESKIIIAMALFLCVSLAAALPHAAQNTMTNINDIKKGELRSGPPSDMKSFADALDWLKANVPESARVISRAPGVAFYYSERKGYWYPYTRNAKTMMTFMIDGKYDYVLADDYSRETKYYLLPFVKNDPAAFRKIYQDGANGTSVYEINKPELAKQYFLEYGKEAQK